MSRLGREWCWRGVEPLEGFVLSHMNVHPDMETSAVARGLTQMSSSGAEASFSGVHNRTNKIFYIEIITH